MNNLLKVLLLTTQKTAISQLNKSANNILLANRRNKNNEKLKRQLINFVFVLLFLFLFLHNAACSSVIAEPTEGCVWDYPIKPGTEEWNNTDFDQIKPLLQVPEHILQCITTENLVLLCLRYPFMINWSAFGNYIHFFDHTLFGYHGFNGTKELATRENDIIINTLLKEYLRNVQNNLDSIESNPNILLSFSVLMDISLIEILLSCPEFHKNVSRETQKKILKDLWYVYNEKIKYSEYYWTPPSFYNNLYSRAHIIIKMEPELSEIFEADPFLLNNGTMAYPEILDKLDSLTIELIK